VGNSSISLIVQEKRILSSLKIFAIPFLLFKMAALKYLEADSRIGQGGFLKGLHCYLFQQTLNVDRRISHLNSSVAEVQWVCEEGDGTILHSMNAPSVLACKVSGRLKALCGENNTQSFSVAKLLVSAVGFGENKTGRSIYDLVFCFIMWLYSGKLHQDGSWCHDLWYLGHGLDAPGFQDYVL